MNDIPNWFALPAGLVGSFLLAKFHNEIDGFFAQLSNAAKKRKKEDDFSRLGLIERLRSGQIVLTSYVAYNMLDILMIMSFGMTMLVISVLLFTTEASSYAKMVAVAFDLTKGDAEAFKYYPIAGIASFFLANIILYFAYERAFVLRENLFAIGNFKLFRDGIVEKWGDPDMSEP